MEGSLGRRRVRVHARVLLCDHRWPEPKSQPRELLKLRKAETALLLSLTYPIRPVDVHDLGVEESRQRSLVSVLSRIAQARLHLWGRRCAASALQHGWSVGRWVGDGIRRGGTVRGCCTMF